MLTADAITIDGEFIRLYYRYLSHFSGLFPLASLLTVQLLKW
jgi:hypothetical protein